jgi:hypothetical protein
MNHFQNLLISANFQFFEVQDSYKILDRIESAAHKLRHALTSLFCIPARTFESQCIMYCLWTSGWHYIHIHSCSTRNMLNGLILQRNPNCNPTNWMTCVLCQYYFGDNIAHFLQEGELIDITSSHSMFHLTQQQASFPLGFILLLLRGFRQEEEKSSRFEGCNCVLMQSVGGLGITDQVCCPIWDLSEGCSSLLLTWPILILVSLGWSRRTTINKGVGPADKVGHLNLQTAYSSKRAMLWPPQLEMIWLGSWRDRILTGLKRLSVWQQQQQQHWLRRGTWNFNNI